MPGTNETKQTNEAVEITESTETNEVNENTENVTMTVTTCVVAQERRDEDDERQNMSPTEDKRSYSDVETPTKVFVRPDSTTPIMPPASDVDDVPLRSPIDVDVRVHEYGHNESSDLSDNDEGGNLIRPVPEVHCNFYVVHNQETETSDPPRRRRRSSVHNVSEDRVGDILRMLKELLMLFIYQRCFHTLAIFILLLVVILLICLSTMWVICTVKHRAGQYVYICGDVELNDSKFKNFTT